MALSSDKTFTAALAGKFDAVTEEGGPGTSPTTFWDNDRQDTMTGIP